MEGKSGTTNFVGNCYAVSEYPLIGSISTVNGDVKVSDCFRIGNTATDYGAAITNNVATIPYKDFYHNPSFASAFLSAYAFDGAYRTNLCYDLVLPLNKVCFPTPTAEQLAKHNYTKALGFKRFIRFNK